MYIYQLRMVPNTYKVSICGMLHSHFPTSQPKHHDKGKCEYLNSLRVARQFISGVFLGLNLRPSLSPGGSLIKTNESARWKF